MVLVCAAILLYNIAVRKATSDGLYVNRKAAQQAQSAAQDAAQDAAQEPSEPEG